MGEGSTTRLLVQLAARDLKERGVSVQGADPQRRWCCACENQLESWQMCEEGEGALGRDRGTSSLARRRARERGQQARERGQGRVITIPWRVDLPATKAKESSALKWRGAILQQLAGAAGCCFWRGAEGKASSCVGLGWAASTRR